MPTRSRSRADTKQLLLEVGLGLLIERGLTVGLDNVRLAEVSEVAGRTTGAAYHIWGSRGDEGYGGGQDRFRRELACLAVETIGIEHDAVIKVLADHPDASMTELIRVGARAALEDFVNPEDGWDVVIGLIAAARSTPELLGPHQKGFGALTQVYVDLFSSLLHPYGRQIRAPFTMEHLCVSLIALAQGYALRMLVDPKGVDGNILRSTGPDGALQRWHLFACSAEGLIDYYTVPI